MSFWSNPFTEDLAVDLGTVHTFIYGRGRGMVVSEPSLVAIDRVTNEVMAVGTEALEMLGRSPEDVEVAYPMREGVVADSELAQSAEDPDRDLAAIGHENLREERHVPILPAHDRG